MPSAPYQIGPFGPRPTLSMPFIPAKQSGDEFNLTDFLNLTRRVVAAQQQLILSYLTSGIRIAEVLRGRREASRHEESNNVAREVPEQTRAASDEVDLSDDSIRARAYELYERRDRRPGDALDDWNRARAELLHVTARQ